MPQRQEIKIKEDVNFLANGDSEVGMQIELHKFPFIDVICSYLKC